MRQASFLNNSDQKHFSFQQVNAASSTLRKFKYEKHSQKELNFNTNTWHSKIISMICKEVRFFCKIDLCGFITGTCDSIIGFPKCWYQIGIFTKANTQN